MANGKDLTNADLPMLQPLREAPQLGARVYQMLVKSIVSGQIESGTPLRPDAVARQLDVSTTPVREAMHHLVLEGLAIKVPNQGWFVRQFTDVQVRELYELRADLEAFGTRLACARIADEEIAWLRQHQCSGESALGGGDMDAYRIYNRDFHTAIIRSARNSYLLKTMGQLQLQSEMLMASTIRITGRPIRAIEEHRRLIERLAARDAEAAGQLMESHILSALEDILCWRRGGGSVVPRETGF
jgi:DNA-binding GntR family transcriptional regulator